MIFMTSNLGAGEMESILRPKLGFGACGAEQRTRDGIVEAGVEKKIARSAVEAARRKFTPEFMNRIDRVVVFHPLCQRDLAQILDLELGMLQQRIFNSASTTPFMFHLTEPAKAFLLREGTDLKYGARHLKRAIERELVHPLSNLVASLQICNGDSILVDLDTETNRMDFVKEEEGVPAYEMVQRAAAAAVGSAGVSHSVVVEAPAAKTTLPRTHRRQL